MLEDEPVRDRTLVLNVLPGLNDRFSYIADLIQRQRHLPRYQDLLADVQLAAMNMKMKPSARAQAFATSGARPPSSAPPPPAPSSGSTGTGGSGKKNRHGGKRPQGGGSGGPPPGHPSLWSGPPSRPTWPAGFNPYTGTFQMWNGVDPRFTSVPGRPASPHPAQSLYPGLLGPVAPLPNPPPLAPIPGLPRLPASTPGPSGLAVPLGFHGLAVSQGWASILGGLSRDPNALSRLQLPLHRPRFGIIVSIISVVKLFLA